MDERHSRLPHWARLGRAGWKNTGAERPHFAVVPRPGQESVWDYPRPACPVSDPRAIVVEFAGAPVARTRASVRVLETSHPPTFYLPPDSIVPGVLVEVGGGSRCEWKGEATYFDVVAARGRAARAAWCYRAPFAEFECIRDFVGFYPALLECYVEGQRVIAQPGGFYAGWVTPELVGPFKGEPGSGGW